ncbi:hypothetical protein ASF29_22260 [Rhizobium sp. Leaf262]|nr:hypothetical protein ASF29_22260 [Rhizobium sp. Leaf262]
MKNERALKTWEGCSMMKLNIPLQNLRKNIIARTEKITIGATCATRFERIALRCFFDLPRKACANNSIFLQISLELHIVPCMKLNLRRRKIEQGSIKWMVSIEWNIMC